MLFLNVPNKKGLRLRKDVQVVVRTILVVPEKYLKLGASSLSARNLTLESANLEKHPSVIRKHVLYLVFGLKSNVLSRKNKNVERIR